MDRKSFNDMKVYRALRTVFVFLIAFKDRRKCTHTQLQSVDDYQDNTMCIEGLLSSWGAISGLKHAYSKLTLSLAYHHPGQ